jgi:hypothetical protein
MAPGSWSEGTVTNASLHDVIQLMCVSRCTCRLCVKSWEGEGLIEFQGGEITHAQCGELTGASAFYETLTFEQGIFWCEALEDEKEATIEESWDYLLLESLRRFDALHG